MATIIRRTTVLATLAVLSLAVAFSLGCTDKIKNSTPTQEQLYVLNEKSNTLQIFLVPGFDPVGDTIAMASPAPHHLHFNSDHTFYYIVSRTANGLVHKYDATTNELKATATLAHFYTGIDIAPGDQSLLVSDFGQDVTQRTKVYSLSPQTLAAVDSFNCGSEPHFVKYTHDGNTVVIVNTGSDELTLYYPHGDPENNITSVKLDPDPDSAAALGHPIFQPYCVAIDDNDSLAYVTCRKSKVADKATIFVFDLPHRRTVDTLYVPWTNRDGSASNYHTGLNALIDNRYLAVASQDGNSVYLIDVTNGSYKEAVVQNNDIFGITASSDGNYIYATANNLDVTPGWVYEFHRDGGNLTVNDSTQVGMLPNGIHIRPSHGSH
jgi:DNA-binding beta-propeller fold protein YncE